MVKFMVANRAFFMYNIGDRMKGKPPMRKKSSVFRLGIVLGDALILVFCVFGAFFTKYAPEIERQDLSVVLIWLPALVCIYLAVNAVFGMYRVLWKYADSFQLIKQAMAAVVSFGVTFIINFVFNFIKGYRPLSNNFLITLCMFSIVGLLMSRLTVQSSARHALKSELSGASFGARRVLVVGAGEAGAHIVEMFNQSRDTMGSVEAIVDDDPGKHGYRISGVPVCGGVEDIPSLVVSEDITDIIIALPTASKQRIREITELSLESGCCVRVMDKLKHIEEA